MRIKVTGYLDTEDMIPEDVDLDHPMGVSAKFYEDVSGGRRHLPTLGDIEFEAEEEG